MVVKIFNFVHFRMCHTWRRKYFIDCLLTHYRSHRFEELHLIHFLFYSLLLYIKSSLLTCFKVRTNCSLNVGNVFIYPSLSLRPRLWERQMCLGAEEIFNWVFVPPLSISQIPQKLCRLNKSGRTQLVTGCCHLFERDQKEGVTHISNQWTQHQVH